MQDPTEQRPGASGRRWEHRFRAARERRGEATPSLFEQRIARGAAGEEILGRQLTALAEEMNLGVLHDMALPGSNANIDHLVIGPAGVSVIDAKTWEGAVWIGRKTMRQGRRSRYKSLVGVHEQVARVRQALDAGGCDDVPVSGLLCMVNANKGVPVDSLKWSAAVGIGNLPNVRRYVARSGELDLSRVRRAYEVLSERFVISGGGYQPSVAPPAAVRSEPDPIDRLIVEINRDERSRRSRRWKRILATAASIVLAVAMSAGLYRSADPPAPAPLSRTELDAMGQQLRGLAVARARGKVRGPRVHRTAAGFELLYRRGRRCRVRLTVARSDRSIAVRSAGCASSR